MRVGKTLIALLACYYLKAKRVLFITKLKAVSSIVSDYESFEFGFQLDVINYEQAHKVEKEYDVIVIDEAHSLGAFPKPALRTKNIREIVGARSLILLSGTPTPESYSQLYHQLWISERSPFAEYTNFYKWAHAFVDIKQKMINGLRINDYKKADRQKIWALVSDYFLTYTQAEAGFEQVVEEQIKYVDMRPGTMELVSALVKDQIITLSTGTPIVADTAVSLQCKVHQLCSGTIIAEDGTREILDNSKALYIRHAYQGKKIAVFYKYTAEATLLRAHLNCTESPEEFNRRDDLTFISQVRSGSMGVNLSTADIIVFYNIDFSAVLYWQARARMQSKDRTKDSIVHWLFATGGIEEKVYDAVTKKKDYTTSYFERDYRGKARKGHTKKDHRVPEADRGVCREGLDREQVRGAGFTRVL